MKTDKNKILQIEFIENVPIAEITTYKIKGVVKGVFFPKTNCEFIAVYNFLKENNLPFKVIGNGSNLLISPKTNNLFISTKKLKQFLFFLDDIVCFSASVPLAKAYSICSKNGIEGFERLAGIPATIGGAIKNNASAFGQSIFDYLDRIRVFKNGRICELKKQDIIYSYHSTNLDDLLILSAKFRLSPASPCKITQDFVEYQKERTSHQPKGFSCGSVFRNPKKMSAGYLIEECGLKGKTCGDAQISIQHANFIINNGNASFKDIATLIKLCKAKVKKQFNIDLETEVEIIE